MSTRISTKGSRIRRSSSGSSNDTLRATSTDRSGHGTKYVSKTSAPELATLWVHDDSFSRDEVLINSDTFSHLSVAPGDLVQIVALKTALDVRDFEQSLEIPVTDTANVAAQNDSSKEATNLSSAIAIGRGASFDVDDNIKYIFLAKPPPADLKAKHPSLQISLSGAIAGTFGFRNRTQVVVSKLERQDCAASHVELIFRDQYLARSDMWRLVNCDLAGKTLYKSQKLLFLGTIKALVKCIWVHGQKVSAAYFSETTVPVFRSESARYVLFIQMSKEMWDFDSEGSGEILFNRVVNGFLPDLFKRWAEIEVKHLVSIVMFGRLEYGQSHSASLVGFQEGLQRSASIPAKEHVPTKDFYRVVVTDMASGQWTAILNELKKEFRIFLRDVSLQEVEANGLSEDMDDGGAPKLQARISGRPSTALRGNILEAINIASSQFANDYIDRDLVRTGISIVVVTPGSGVFEVDRDLLNLTTANLTNNGIGIDLVCLSKMPLHSVPLFKYLRQKGFNSKSGSQPESLTVLHSVAGSWSSRTQGISPSASSAYGSLPRSLSRFSSLAYPSNLEEFYYGIPQWIDLSYWNADLDTNHALPKLRRGERKLHLDSTYPKPFVPRLRMYELQMMGVMELGLANISIPYMSEGWQFALHSSVSGPRLHDRLFQISPTLRHRRAPEHPKRTSMAGERKQGLLTVQAKQQGDFYNRMDDYDGNLFNTYRGHRKAGNSSPNKKVQIKSLRTANGEQRTEVENSAIKKTKINSNKDGSEGGTKDLKKAVAEIEVSPTPSSIRVMTEPARPASRFSRSISYALRGLAPPSRAVASTTIDVHNVLAEPSTKSNTPSKAFSSAQTGLKSPLAAQPHLKGRPSLESDSSDPSDSGLSGSDGRPSEPIKIGTPERKAQGRMQTPSQIPGLAHRDMDSKTSLSDMHHDIKVRLSGENLHEKLSDGSEPKTDEDEGKEPPQLSPLIRKVNPSNPMRSDPKAATWVGRWQHLYPRTPKMSGMKWRSLCTPASVPLTTEEFPTKEELVAHYEQSSYTVSQDASKELSEIPKTRESLLYQMLTLRFAHGYQLVVGESLVDAFGPQASSHLTFVELEKLAQDGNFILLSMGNSLQKLSFMNQTEVKVIRYVRKVPPDESVISRSISYRPSIRQILSPTYTTMEMKLAGFSKAYPWEMADRYLAGWDDDAASHVEQLRFWRARFVLIPVEPPASAHRPIQAMSEDNEEEIHLLGIRALTQMWQRYRYIPPEGPKFKSTMRRRKDENPLEINFQTMNPSEVVATELDKISSAEDAGEGRSTQLLPDSEMLERETCTLPKLAQIMQSEKGVEITTRRWHLQLHFHCFKGDDFTDWLTLNFKDIGTRDEAVEFGNELMQHGLFHHANKRHNFKDGNYFYQIDAEHRAPRPEVRNSWFPTSRRSDRSVPPTPAAEPIHKDSPLSSRSRSDSSSADGEKVPASAPAKSSLEKKRISISLSKMMRLDVDHRKRSNRPEIINLHYDKLHNPENCYHVELSWINVTSKLVEDAIATWATTGDKYGLKLVEVPILEVSRISDHEPFRAPSRVSLAVSPPKTNVSAANGNTYFTSTSFTPQAPQKSDPLLYHKALLKNFNFVLDLEAASDFPADVDVNYSWGKLEYRYSQFVHRTGVLLAQITDEGDFLLLANRLYNTRSASAKDSTGKFDNKKDLQSSRAPALPPTQASGILGVNVPNLSPQLSPMVYASSDVFGSKAALTTSGMQKYITPEQIFWELDDFCKDKGKLEAFYKEVTSAPPAAPRKSSSSGSSALRPVGDLDMSIPELRLPPSLSPAVAAGIGSVSRFGRKTSPNFGDVGRESPRRKPIE